MNNIEIFEARRPFWNYGRNTDQLDAIRWFARAASIGLRPENPTALEEIVNELIAKDPRVRTRPEDILRLLRHSQARAASRGTVDSWIKFDFEYGCFTSLEFDAIVRPGVLTNIKIEFNLSDNVHIANVSLTGEASDIIPRYRHADGLSEQIILLDRYHVPRYQVAQGQDTMTPCPQQQR